MQFATLTILLCAFRQQSEEERKQHLGAIFAMCLRKRCRHVRHGRIDKVRRIIAEKIPFAILDEFSGGDVAIVYCSALHTPTLTLKPTTPATFSNVSSVTLPSPVSKLESVCTDTPLNFASRVCVMSSVSRLSTIALPISSLFIKVNNTLFLPLRKSDHIKLFIIMNFPGRSSICLQ